jgi:hypothetical protein
MTTNTPVRRDQAGGTDARSGHHPLSPQLAALRPTPGEGPAPVDFSSLIIFACQGGRELAGATALS